MIIDVEKLWKVGTLPMNFQWVSDEVEIVSDAILETASVYPHGLSGEGRPLTRDEVEWVNANHPEWVAKMATEEHQPEPEEHAVPSCDYFGTLSYI